MKSEETLTQLYLDHTIKMGKKRSIQRAIKHNLKKQNREWKSIKGKWLQETLGRKKSGCENCENYENEIAQYTEPQKEGWNYNNNENQNQEKINVIKKPVKTLLEQNLRQHLIT